MNAQSESPLPASARELQSPGRARALAPDKAQKQRALRIVKRYMLLSAGAGLIPAPLFDQVLVGGLLAKMLCDLCEVYGVKVTSHKAKAVIAAILGGAHTEWGVHYLLRYADKYLPGVSTAAGRVIVRPAVAAAIAYGIGMLFVHHFDKGAWLSKGLPAANPGPTA